MAVSNVKTMEKPRSGQLVALMAQRFDLEPEEFKRVVKDTCGLQKASDEQFLAFLAVAHEHDLNPLTKEIYAFPKPGGGIQPIIGVDGWLKKMNQHPAFDGIEYSDMIEGGRLVAITARIYRKDRSHPTEATEYMKECQRGTDPWRQWPARMLRHRAAIQAIRIAFNLAGVMDPEEADRWLATVKVAREATITSTMRTNLDEVADSIPADEPTRPKQEDKTQVVETTATAIEDDLIGDDELKIIAELADQAELHPAAVDRLAKQFGATDRTKLTQGQVGAFLKALEAEGDKRR